MRNLRWPTALLTVLVLLMLGGCATVTKGGAGQQLDPWENWNRKVFGFNERLDEAVLKPVATAYSKVVPQPIRRGLNNVFANVGDAWSAVNSLLQGKLADSLSSMIRFGTNSVFGLLGVFDVATEAGIERHPEDFGQTLGRWGMGPGAYVVWPLLGPSTLRESLAMPLDLAVSPALFIHDTGVNVSLTSLRLLNERANLLGASKLLDDIALDKYTFLRDAYLQQRRSLIYDGNEPPTPEPADGPASAPR